jgi:hypothetical protein
MQSRHRRLKNDTARPVGTSAMNRHSRRPEKDAIRSFTDSPNSTISLTRFTSKDAVTVLAEQFRLLRLGTATIVPVREQDGPHITTIPRGRRGDDDATTRRASKMYVPSSTRRASCRGMGGGRWGDVMTRRVCTTRATAQVPAVPEDLDIDQRAREWLCNRCAASCH